MSVYCSNMKEPQPAKWWWEGFVMFQLEGFLCGPLRILGGLCVEIAI
jgi:hypothetical protein